MDTRSAIEQTLREMKIIAENAKTAQITEAVDAYTALRESKLLEEKTPQEQTIATIHAYLKLKAIKLITTKTLPNDIHAVVFKFIHLQTLELITEQSKPADIKGLLADVDTNKVKEAYRKLALKWHPDRNPNTDAEPDKRSQAEVHFKKVGEANTALIKLFEQAEQKALTPLATKVADLQKTQKRHQEVYDELKKSIEETQHFLDLEKKLTQTRRTIEDNKSGMEVLSSMYAYQASENKKEHEQATASLTVEIQKLAFLEEFAHLSQTSNPLRKLKQAVTKSFVEKNGDKPSEEFIKLLTAHAAKEPNTTSAQAWKKAKNAHLPDQKEEYKSVAAQRQRLFKIEAEFKQRADESEKLRAQEKKQAEEKNQGLTATANALAAEIDQIKQSDFKPVDLDDAKAGLADVQRNLDEFASELTELLPQLEKEQKANQQPSKRDTTKSGPISGAASKDGAEIKSASSPTIPPNEEKQLDPYEAQSLANAFRLIYNGIREGQSGSNWFKTNFLSQHHALSDQQLVNEIRQYSLTNPDSRTATAWRLTQEHHHHCHQNNLVLVYDMYLAAFERSGSFKKSLISGTSYSDAGLFKARVTHFTYEELQRAQHKAGSRGAKILQSLPPEGQPRYLLLKAP